MIRALTIDDVEKVYPLCVEHYDKVNMKRRGYSEINKLISIETLRSMAIEKQKYITLISDDFSGIISFVVGHTPFSDDKVASEFLWYAKNNRLFIKLFDAMEFILLKKVDKISIGMGVDSFTLINYLIKKGYYTSDILLTKKVGV